MTSINKADRDTLERAPVESDTRIIRSKITSVNSILCKWEYWAWDGVYAETMVFLEKHVQNKNDEEIVSLCEPLFEDKTAQTTLTRRNGYVFVNYNFYVS